MAAQMGQTVTEPNQTSTFAMLAGSQAQLALELSFDGRILCQL